jgi:hypothetical protein
MRYDLTFTSAKGESQHFEFVSDYENEARATVGAILYDWPAASNISLLAAGDQFQEPYDVSYPREDPD